MASVAQRPVSRNDPCPCGSGRRYKDCHGSLRASGAQTVPAPTAGSYRPAGSDWAGLDAAAMDRLGAMMERALRCQREMRMRDAERLYRAVLEEATQTHDALHMLGVVRLGLGDYPEAEQLLRRAMALRPPYAAIEQNWALVQRSIAGRDRRGIDIVCEHALPLLMRSLATANERRPPILPARTGLHVVGRVNDDASDAAWVSRRIGQLLAPLEPVRWKLGPVSAAPTSWTRIDRQTIDVAAGRRPPGGAVILTHIEADTDAWLRESIDRVLVFVQAASPSAYLERLRRVAADGGRPVTLMLTSQAKARRFGGDAIVVPPPIDVSEFPAMPTSRTASVSALRVAVCGQDGRRVVAADDAELLKTLAARAGEMALYDPGPLRYDVGTLRNVHCIARGARTLDGVLAGADVYFHRRLPWWSEGEGRAMFGAMALGVPVVCARDAVFAEYVDDGVDGWLYDDDASALAVIDALRADAARVRAAGVAARAKAQRLFEPSALAHAYVAAVTRWLGR
jgi:glycosyltransferase involved in cell wall biosynthesis